MIALPNTLVQSSYVCISLEDFKTEEAIRQFDRFKEIGVIKSGVSYKDNVWKLTDEYSNVGLYFKFDRFHYSNYESIFEIYYDDFIEYVKAFAISLLGKNALFSIESFLLDLRHIIASTYDDVCNMVSPERINLPSLCSEFFSVLPGSNDNPNISVLLDVMDLYSECNLKTSKGAKRNLANFMTYFKFDKIMKDFWESELSEEDRLFYYPIYLWWTLTAVIPLRPREFLLTQRDCLIKNKDEYKLTLMRNRLKGSRKKISYKISNDYFQTTYPIPDKLGKEFERYLEMTSEYDNTDINTLFVTDVHYLKWKQKKHSNSRYLSYTNLATILSYFYNEIILTQLHYSIVECGTHRQLKENEIGKIHLGDTRHIAIINLMQEGGTPATAMYLAGHSNEEMSAHYGSNIAELIECKTYMKYRELIGGEKNYAISSPRFALGLSEGTTVADNGTCYSSNYANGLINDCLESAGPNGEIGYCPTCTYYRKNNYFFFEKNDIYRRQINDDYKKLYNAIQVARTVTGETETIGQALLNLKASSTSYQAFLMAKHNKH